MNLCESINEAIEQSEYDSWLKRGEELNNLVDQTEKEMKKVTGDTKGALVSDEIKASKEYKNSKSKFDKAFKILKDFNKKSPKEFFKKKSLDKRAKWKTK